MRASLSSWSRISSSMRRFSASTSSLVMPLSAMNRSGV